MEFVRLVYNDMGSSQETGNGKNSTLSSSSGCWPHKPSFLRTKVENLAILSGQT